jgi:DnaJ-class molecular chaperone
VFRPAFSFDIPPGVEDGQVLRVPIPFELLKHARDDADFFYIYISVEKSNYFLRDDLDVHSDTDVSPAQALLGGSVAVRGLHKDLLDVSVAPGTCSHSSALVPDEGVVRSDRLVKGSHLVNFGIRVPDSLTEAERRIWTAFAKLEQNSSDSMLDGCINGVDSVMGHKFEFGAIDPVAVERVFNKKVLPPAKKKKDFPAAPESQREDGFRAILKKIMTGA